MMRPPSPVDWDPTACVLSTIRTERRRQDEKFPHQIHKDFPDGTGGPGTVEAANAARYACDALADKGALTWGAILREEVEEAFAETDPHKLRSELIQVAAVAVKWIEAIDRRIA